MAPGMVNVSFSRIVDAAPCLHEAVNQTCHSSGPAWFSVQCERNAIWGFHLRCRTFSPNGFGRHPMSGQIPSNPPLNENFRKEDTPC